MGPGGGWGTAGLQSRQALPKLCPLPSALRLSECHFKPEHMPRLAASLSQALQLTELT